MFQVLNQNCFLFSFQHSRWEKDKNMASNTEKANTRWKGKTKILDYLLQDKLGADRKRNVIWESSYKVQGELFPCLTHLIELCTESVSLSVNSISQKGGYSPSTHSHIHMHTHRFKLMDAHTHASIMHPLYASHT